MKIGYYSKLQERFINKEEYFDELLFQTLESPFDKPINKNYKNEL